MIKVSNIKSELKEANRVIPGYPVVLTRGYEWNAMQSAQENLERLAAEAQAKGKKFASANIMFESNDVVLGGGFNTGARRKIHFESGTPEALMQVVDHPQFKLKEGKELPQYRIIVLESTEQSDPSQPHKVYPEGHTRAGEPVTCEGALIYRSTKLVAVNSPEGDVLLPIDKEVAEASSDVPAEQIATNS